MGSGTAVVRIFYSTWVFSWCFADQVVCNEELIILFVPIFVLEAD